ncbi:MAG: Bax inhibitor-1/YccA family protein [Oscillospiraceae bacterium]|nr:Bax inhibitor-1/YccA family protein [Oscillospiraceae bacterium]
MDYNGNETSGRPMAWEQAENMRRALSACLTRVFMWMFAALVVTGFTALIVANSNALTVLVFGNPVIFYGLLIVEIGLVFGISAGMNKLSSGAAAALFFVYAAVNGLTLSVVFIVYELGTIYAAFGICAVMFAVMAGFGAVTKKDLSSVGSLLFMALIGLIAASLVNFFLQSEMLDYLVCYAGILIFVGLTAYDTQRTKKMLASAVEAGQEEAVRKISVIGALSLYLDFINLFLKILRLLGKRR